MSLNTVDEIYKFLGLSATEVQPSVVEVALVDASGIVEAFNPVDASDRSTRMQPIRKLAEAYFAGANVFLHFANIFFLSQPPVRLLNIMSMGAGADSPNPLELLSGLQRAAEIYKAEGFFWLNKSKPNPTSIRAGK